MQNNRHSTKNHNELEDNPILSIQACCVFRDMTECFFCRTMLKESKDHRGLVELVESTIQKFSTVQDVARRISSYVSLNTPTMDAGTFSLLP